MKFAPFETIAKPHYDILRGNFTMDTYAAKLAQVVKKEGPLEYRNAQQFFDRTHVTEGLKKLLSGVEGHLKGRRRQHQDPIIQLQTPFGGGKTHTLIALYHKAKEWNATPVVIVGSEMDAKPEDTFWGQIAVQLTGSRGYFDTPVAPGSKSLVKLFEQHNKPVMILMDEVLNYLEGASGVPIQKNTLADQTIRFMLTLTEAVTSPSVNVALIVTLQESEIAPLEAKFPLFKDLLDRMKRVVTPVEDSEIDSIIRTRLFSKDQFNTNTAKKVIREFTQYADKEGILPEGKQASEYRTDFEGSYPFLPDVIDVLYKQWGSFPDFQRTRGVLRLLAHVVHRACGKNLPYITLADFDLSNTDIRAELIEHAGQAFQGIIANDITGRQAGAKTVDRELESVGKNLALGTRTATATFLYSFTGKGTRGATIAALKRNATHLEIPASNIDTAVNKLTNELAFLRTENGKSYFDTQPSLGRTVQIRIQNIAPEKRDARAAKQRRESFKASGRVSLKTYIAPKDGMDIPDTADLKLIVLPQRDDTFCQKLIETRGDTPRVYRNTLFFLVPIENTATHLNDEISNVIAYEEIQKDRTLNLSQDQKKEVSDTLRNAKTALNDAIRKDYRLLFVPTKNGLREEDLGMPALGMNTPFDETVYETLHVKGDILQSIGPRNIALRYLKQEDTVSTEQLLNSSLRAPGETRVLQAAWETGISQGVQAGNFALGKKVGGQLIPHSFRDTPPPITFDSDEVLIQPNLIREHITPEDILRDYLGGSESASTSLPFHYTSQAANQQSPLREAWITAIREGVQKGTFGLGEIVDDQPVPRAFMEEPRPITLSDNEIILDPALCTKLIVEPPPQEPPDSMEGVKPSPEPCPPIVPDPSRKTIGLRFTLPHGKVSNVAQHLSQLQANFQNIQLELQASDGEISPEAYEELIENLRELGTEVEEI